MKRLLCIFTILCLASCTEVSFPTHQPKGIKPLSAFPKELRGSYLASEGDSIPDTLLIQESSYEILNGNARREKVWPEVGVINDSLVIKKYKGYYFISFKENNEWLLRVLTIDKKGSLTFMRMAVHDSEKVRSLSELKKEIPVQEIKLSDSEKYYRIDPTPKQLMSLIKKKKFWEESELIKLK